MQCPKCKKQISNTATFCGYCGETIAIHKKNVVGEDVHTSTSSKTVVNNCTVRLSANL